MILHDREIRYGQVHWNLVEPFSYDQVQPGSYDVLLGKEFVYPDMPAGKVIAPEFFLLEPGDFVLGTTLEYVRVPHNMTVFLHGKSSLARRGLIIHTTAGLIDAGFQGNITLELLNVSKKPLLLTPGMRIGQLTFHQMMGTATQPYAGRYQGQLGTTPSRPEKQ